MTAKKSSNKDQLNESFEPLFEWLSDVSLENISPQQAYKPGGRELKLAVGVFDAFVPQTNYVRYDMKLSAHIMAGDEIASLAEIKYSIVVDKKQKDVNKLRVAQYIYPRARQSLAEILRMAGHVPPLPEKLPN